MSLGLAMHQFATVARGTKYSKKWCVQMVCNPKMVACCGFHPFISLSENLIVMVFISSLARHPIT